MYAKIESGIAVEYPVYEGQLQQRFPDRTYPLDTSGDPIPEGYVRVSASLPPDPAFDNYQYRYELGLPVFVNESWVETYNKIELTEDEKNRQRIASCHLMREKRNALLRESDKKVVIDRWEKMSDQEKLEWATYRQELRDIPEQEGFPYSVTWPLEPSKFVIKTF
jgi:hypothetical protein